MSELEARVKALEDILANVSSALIAAPQKETVKTVPATLVTTTVTWVPMTPTARGPWDKTVDINNPELQVIITKLKATPTGRAFHDKILYWLLNNQTTNVVEGVGRRVTR